MQEDAILEIDLAALGLINALEKYSADLSCCMNLKDLDALRNEIINLRRSLLGLEMGMLYQHKEYEQELLSQAVASEKVSVKQVAENLIKKLQQ